MFKIDWVKVNIVREYSYLVCGDILEKTVKNILKVSLLT